MTSEVSINESKEAIVALVAVGAFVVRRTRDGIDVGDGVALFDKLISDVEFRGKIVAAAKGADKIPSELKDLSFGEGIELMTTLVNELQSELQS